MAYLEIPGHYYLCIVSFRLIYKMIKFNQLHTLLINVCTSLEQKL